jgi:hypothetical protein
VTGADEAVRTATFGAAATIYVASSWALGSTPMIGFDPEAVHREFGLAANEVPIMLMSVGAERPGTGCRSRVCGWPRCWTSFDY